jgi:hypothetical protein
MVLFLLLVSLASALDNGVALPPMGWSTWNTLRAAFNESVLHDVAAAMVSTGLVGAGYVHLNIDDGYLSLNRGADGNLVPNPSMFPSGMPALAGFLAQRGMELGIYTSHCEKTCLGFPGALGHEKQDAELYASWPVSLVKNDNCQERQLSLGGATLWAPAHDGGPPAALATDVRAQGGRLLRRSRRGRRLWSSSWLRRVAGCRGITARCRLNARRV